MRDFSGINYLDQHSYRDLGLTISARDVGAPNKAKVKQTLPFSNKTYDFSHLYGAQVFEERQMTYTFDLMKPGKIDTNTKLNVIKTRIVNWLANSQGKQPLYDDVYPQYYFLAEVETGSGFTNENWTSGKLEVTFTAYPFMISELPEGHDIWDEFNFELDVAQPVDFYPMRSTFRPLEIGDRLTIGIWSNYFEGTYTSINQRLLGRSYTVGNVRSTGQSYSERSYYVAELDEWVVEQDVVEAQEGAEEVNVINAGTAGVTPIITTDYDLSIIREDGTVLNVQSGTITNDLFTLSPGDNKMVISAWTGVLNRPAHVHFDWHKELI